MSASTLIVRPRRGVRPPYNLLEHLEPRRFLSAAELLAAIPAPPYSPSGIDDTLIFQDRLFFTDAGNGERLWITDGSGPPTQLFKSNSLSGGDDVGVTALTIFNNQFFFFATGTSGDGLYTSDGTIAGTRAVKIFRNFANVLPQRTFQLNGRLCFFWTDPGMPVRLWSTDGSESGTSAVWTSPQPMPIQAVSSEINGHVFIGSAGKLWRTDGTAEGTSSIWNGLPEIDYPGGFVSTTTRLFFLSMGFDGHSLYTADLDGNSVTQIKIPGTIGTIQPGVSDNLSVLNDRVLFNSPTVTNYNDRLFATDGTDAGTLLLAGGSVGDELSSAFAAKDGLAVFVRRSDITSLNGIWVTDGTRAGTHNIFRQTFDLYYNPMFAAAGRVFITANIGNVGLRLYQTDGTTTSTHPINYFDVKQNFGERYYGFEYRPVTVFRGRFLLDGWRDSKIELWSLDPDVPTGSITAVPFLDINRTGRQEGFETGYWTIAYLDRNDNNAWNDGVDVSRYQLQSYFYDGLPPGRYSLRINDTNPLTTPEEYQIDLQPGQNFTATFGISNQYTVIWGTLFNDANGNGIREIAEPPLPQQNVYLDLNDSRRFYYGVDPTQRTSGDGTFAFILPEPRAYSVRWDDTLGWRQTAPPNRGSIGVTIGTGEVIDAGAIGIVAAQAGTITGGVFYDLNRNGIHDAGDRPVTSAFVYIDENEDGSREFMERFAGVNTTTGIYTFPPLVPGRYTVGLSALNYNLSFIVNLAPGTTATVPDFLITDPIVLSPPDTTPPTVLSASYDPDTNKLRIFFSEDVGGTLFGNDLYCCYTAPGVPYVAPPPLDSYDPVLFRAVFLFPGNGLPNGTYTVKLHPIDVYDHVGNLLSPEFVFQWTVRYGDLNGDGLVSIADFITLASNFGKTNATYSQGDINRDGTISIADFIDLAANFNTSLPASALAISPQAPANESISSSIDTPDLLEQNTSFKKHGRGNVAADWQLRRRPHHRRRHDLRRQ